MLRLFKTGILLAGLTALLMGFGFMIGGQAGLILMGVFSGLMNLGSWFFSDKLVLKMTRAQPVPEEQAPWLYQTTRRLSERANIPMPRLFVVPDPSPNAFATGRSPKHGVVAVNEGLMQLLTKDELEGVIAHEIAHIKHRDTLTSAVAATVAGAISAIGQMAMFAAMFGGGDEESPNPFMLIVMMIFGPMAATIIQLAVSRVREYQADKTAAQLTGRVDGLQNALLKLERGVQMVPSHSMSQSTAHMAIVNPLSGGGGLSFLAKLFSTHPPIQDRVAKLEALRGSV